MAKGNRGGRPPKPTKLKVIQGNPGKRPLNKDEPRYDPADLMQLPKGLPDIAVTVWEEYAPELMASKVLTIVDTHNFFAFCVNYAMWVKAVETLLEKGTPLTEFAAQGGNKKNPEISALTEFQKNWVQLGTLLGLDPSSRTRLSIPGTHGKDNPFGNRRRKIPNRQ